MRLILRAGSNPAFEQVFLFLRQDFVCLGRRHQVIRVRCGDPVNQRTCLRLARNDCLLLQGRLADVQPQVGLAGLGIRAVTLKTVLRQNRLNVAVEFDRAGLGKSAGDGQTRHDG